MPCCADYGHPTPRTEEQDGPPKRGEAPAAPVRRRCHSTHAKRNGYAVGTGARDIARRADATWHRRHSSAGSAASWAARARPTRAAQGVWLHPCGRPQRAQRGSPPPCAHTWPVKTRRGHGPCAAQRSCEWPGAAPPRAVARHDAAAVGAAAKQSAADAARKQLTDRHA